MARVVVVHGIGQQFEGALTLHGRYAVPLREGIRLAGGAIDDADIQCADYGVLFRTEAEYLGPEQEGDPDDLVNDYESELLHEWWTHAAGLGLVPPVDAEVLAGSGSWAKTATVMLCNTPFFARIADQALRGNLSQVRAYFQDRSLRQRIRERVAVNIGADTKVVVGHSLGSVIAYEVLCAQKGPPTFTLVTLGSPLGIPGLIFDRLEPSPAAEKTESPRGEWPRSVRAWTNICAKDDIVAAVPDLRPLFGNQIIHAMIENGARAHNMAHYLTDRSCGLAILDGLAG